MYCFFVFCFTWHTPIGFLNIYSWDDIMFYIFLVVLPVRFVYCFLLANMSIWLVINIIASLVVVGFIFSFYCFQISWAVYSIKGMIKKIYLKLHGKYVFKQGVPYLFNTPYSIYAYGCLFILSFSIALVFIMKCCKSYLCWYI